MKNDRTKINSPPFFSVIIATYNRKNLIERALNSLVSQTEKDWEAIIVDDGSTDDTHSRILPYLESYPDIKYLKQPHKGEALSKNSGIWSAEGVYITFLDSDDEYSPIHLETRKTILLQNPSVRFLYGGAKVLGNQYVPDRFDPKRKINLKESIIGGTFFVERNTLMSLNGFRDILLGSDSDLFDRVKKANVNIMEVQQPTYIYHHETTDSITNRMLLHL